MMLRKARVVDAKLGARAAATWSTNCSCKVHGKWAQPLEDSNLEKLAQPLESLNVERAF